MAKIRIVCPSMGREDIIIRSIVAEYSEHMPIDVVVFESEIRSYQTVLPDCSVYGIPDDVIGKPRKLNWIMDNLFTSEYDAVMFLDDDIKKVVWTMAKKSATLSPLEFLEVLQEDYELSTVLEARVFSLMYYTGPMYLNRFSPVGINETRGGSSIWGGAMMLLDRTYRFDENLPFAEDVDICYMNMFKHGIYWDDRRYGCVPIIPMYTPGHGGVTTFRTASTITEIREYLRNKYGSWVRVDRAI